MFQTINTCIGNLLITPILVLINLYNLGLLLKVCEDLGKQRLESGERLSHKKGRERLSHKEGENSTNILFLYSSLSTPCCQMLALTMVTILLEEGSYSPVPLHFISLFSLMVLANELHAEQISSKMCVFCEVLDPQRPGNRAYIKTKNKKQTSPLTKHSQALVINTNHK